MGMNETPPPGRTRWTVRREPGFDPRVIAPGLTLGDPLASKPRRPEPRPTAPEPFVGEPSFATPSFAAPTPAGDDAPLDLGAAPAPALSAYAPPPPVYQPVADPQALYADAEGLGRAGLRAGVAQDPAEGLADPGVLDPAAASYATEAEDPSALDLTAAEPQAEAAPAPAAKPGKTARRPKPKPDIVRPLRRRPPRNRLMWGLALGAVALTLVAGAAVLVGPKFGLRFGPQPVAEDAEHAVNAGGPTMSGSVVARAAAKAGMVVEDVLVEGRERTPMSAVAAALGVNRGDPIMGFDAEAARLRLMAVSWIERATVERRLPNMIYVRLEERVPLAVWQREGRFSVVDAKGVVVVEGELGPYAALPQVIGEGANTAAEELLIMLAAEPTLKARVAAATRVGKRRWTLRMDNGVDVMLPEEAPDFAYGQLAELQRDKQVLERDVTAIDLRQSDRMILRLTKEAADKLRPPTPAAAPKRHG